MNAAIEDWLERVEAAAERKAGVEMLAMSVEDRLAFLRDRKARGTFVAAAASLGKADLVETLVRLGVQADQRMSGDRLVGMLGEKLR